MKQEFEIGVVSPTDHTVLMSCVLLRAPVASPSWMRLT
jgi:hypothetical protein